MIVGFLVGALTASAGWGALLYWIHRRTAEAIQAALTVRNQEFQQYALQNFKEAALDLVATLTKR